MNHVNQQVVGSNPSSSSEIWRKDDKLLLNCGDYNHHSGGFGCLRCAHSLSDRRDNV